MNEPLFAAAYQQLADALLAIHRSREWSLEYDSFDAYVAGRWNLPKTRARLLVNFAKFCGLCREEGIPIPETPETVAPIFRLAQKRWLQVWQMVRQYAEAPYTSDDCQGIMNHFGIYPNDRPPEHVVKGRKIRRAAKTIAEMKDGTELVREIGGDALGDDWDDAVRVAVDADCERRSERAR